MSFVGDVSDIVYYVKTNCGDKPTQSQIYDCILNLFKDRRDAAILAERLTPVLASKLTTMPTPFRDTKSKFRKRLGAGTFGSVTLREIPKRWERVEGRLSTTGSGVLAVKKLLSEFGQDSLMEIAGMTKCRGPNVVPLIDFNVTRIGTQLILPAATGDVDSFIESLKPETRTWENLRSFVFSLFVGLYQLEKNKFVHRDLKPGNLLVNSEGYVWVSDFGLGVLRYTPGMYMAASGTPYYIAPEFLVQWFLNLTVRPKINFGSRSVDAWSAGCIVYSLFTGQYIPGTTISDFSPAALKVETQMRDVFLFAGLPLDTDPTYSSLDMSLYSDIPRRTDLPSFAARIYAGVDIPLQAKQLFASLLCVEPLLRPTFKQILQSGLFDGLPMPDFDESNVYEQLVIPGTNDVAGKMLNVCLQKKLGEVVWETAVRILLGLKDKMAELSSCGLTDEQLVSICIMIAHLARLDRNLIIPEEDIEHVICVLKVIDFKVDYVTMYDEVARMIVDANPLNFAILKKYKDYNHPLDLLCGYAVLYGLSPVTVAETYLRININEILSNAFMHTNPAIMSTVSIRPLIQHEAFYPDGVPEGTGKIVLPSFIRRVVAADSQPSLGGGAMCPVM